MNLIRVIPSKILPANSKKGFSFLPGINRGVVPSHVSKIAKSIEKMGILRAVVVATLSFIDGVKQTYIIDGQHLYLACIRLSTDIEYKEIVVKDMQDLVEHISFLNSSSRSWSLIDYIVAWQNVVPDYKILMAAHQIYDIEMTQLAEILHHGTTFRVNPGSSVQVNLIKKGNFRVKDYSTSKILLDQITDMLKEVPRLDRMSNKALIASFCQFVTNNTSYNHTAYMKKIKANKDLFKLATQDADEFKKIFESL